MPSAYNESNPITVTREQLGLSVMQLANKAGIAVRTLRHLEAGNYLKIPAPVLVILIDINPNIQADYRWWIRTKREFFGMPKLAIEELNSDTSPVQQLLSFWNLGINELASALCVERYCIQQSIRGYYQSIPTSLATAFIHADLYNQRELDQMDQLALEFFRKCVQARLEKNSYVSGRGAVPAED